MDYLARHIFLSKAMVKNTTQIITLKKLQVEAITGFRGRNSHKLLLILLVALTTQLPQILLKNRRNFTFWVQKTVIRRTSSPFFKYLVQLMVSRKKDDPILKLSTVAPNNQLLIMKNCINSDFDLILDDLGLEHNIFDLYLKCVLGSQSVYHSEFLLRFYRLPVLSS